MPNSSPLLDTESTRTVLKKQLHEAAHLLPGQAPIGAFVHHNTLHSFEHLSFHKAVKLAHDIYDAEPYMKLTQFREAFQQGRIHLSDLEAELKEWFGYEEKLPARMSAHDLYLIALLHPLEENDTAKILWLLNEKELLDKPPQDLKQQQTLFWMKESKTYLENLLEQEDRSVFLSRICSWETTSGLEEHLGCSLSEANLPKVVENYTMPLVFRYLWGECARLSQGMMHRQPSHSEHEKQLCPPTNQQLHPILSRLAACFLDTGMAYWAMPERDKGFYQAARQLFQHSFHWSGSWVQEAKKAFQSQEKEAQTAEETVLLCLHQLDISESEQAEFLKQELLALPGWAGMFWRLETHPEDRLRSFPYSLMDYLAVRLTLKVAIEQAAKETSSLQTPSEAMKELEWLQPAYTLFQLFVYSGTHLSTIGNLRAKEAWQLYHALTTFDLFQRRAVFQEAYERSYRNEILNAVAANAKKQRELPPPAPKVQLAFCIDDREESLRRHVEECEEDYETYGIAGFYGLAIAYKGLTDGHRVPLCPASQTPKHKINEVPEDSQAAEKWTRRYALAGQLGFAGYVGTKNMVRGFLFSLAGTLEAFPMLVRLLSPRWGYKLRSYLRQKALTPPRTKLTSIHTKNTEPNVGFTPLEAVARIEQVLQDMGLTSNFARLVIVLGHGSTSMNNPHEAAHECGACSGGKGGPNARLFADLLNRPMVRAGLQSKEIHIPDTTIFVGGMHDTSDDSITLYDLHRVPLSHQTLLEEAQQVLNRARMLDAHERCRRFESVSLTATPQQALNHVEGRAQNLAEPRPEYGHCTNAICLVGRRWLQRGLFLDRRAFLVSYDPTQDKDGSILERILASVGPVGAGINLEYYFSYVDQEKYGCGTKLPHNVTGLIGVVNGHEGDLRTGLPYQMIDIHEPMRLLTIVEATPNQLLQIAERQPAVKTLVTNQWIQLVAMHPDTGQMYHFTSQGFVPYQPSINDLPEFSSSFAYYQGHREHLKPARILSGLEGSSHA